MAGSYISLFDLIDFDRFDTFIKLNIRIYGGKCHIYG